MPISKLTRNLLSVVAASVVSVAAQASDAYPSKTIKMIVGFGAGGTADAIARYYAQKLSEVLKVSVIVDNKPGAGQIVAIKSMTASPPDGYTLLLGTASAFSQGPGVRDDLPYDPLKDFTLIGLVASVPGVIVVTPKLPARTFAELVKYSNDNPTTLNYGSSGIGAASHLQAEYLLSLSGIKMTHIPYKADAEIMRELAAGTVHMGLSPVQGAMGLISAGRVRAFAVTGSKRVSQLPDVPSLSEADVKGLQGIDIYSYYGLVGPIGLSPAIVTIVNNAINKVSAMPEVITYMQDRLVADPASGTTAAFREYIQKDLAKWKTLAKHVKLSN